MSNSPPSLTVPQLFIPAPSGVLGSGAVPSLPASGSWLSVEYQVAATVGLPTTAWQSGGPERTILAVNAVCLSLDDALISLMAQGGFLDSAASGTASYQTLNGTIVTVPVTPDPSNAAQNPAGTLGWLDDLGQNVYGVDRIQATYAAGPLAFANVSGSTAGPFLAGQYHVSNVVNGSTFSNVSSLTIPTSVIPGSGGIITGVTPGVSLTTISTAPNPHGLTVGNVVFLAIPVSSGVAPLSNVFATVTAVTSTTFQVALGSSGTWTAGGQVYLCTIAQVSADVVGISSNSAPGTITNTITQANGVSCSNVVAFSGSNWESNTAYAARCRLALATASPNGPAQAYEYYAETAQQLLADGTPAYNLTKGPVTANVYANPQTGIITVVVASSTPVSTTLGNAVTPGCSQLLVTGVSNATSCVVTCAGPTSLVPGQSMAVIITGVLGTIGVNGGNIATYVSANSFAIPVNTTSSGTYTGGGSVEGGDLGQIDNLIQDNVVPDGIVGAVTVSALALPITVVATVVVPQANVPTYQIAALQALQAYLKSLPIGGEFSPTETVPVAYDGIVGALEEAGVITLGSSTYVRGISSLTLNGNNIDVPFPSNAYQALLSNATAITVVGV